MQAVILVISFKKSINTYVLFFEGSALILRHSMPRFRPWRLKSKQHPYPELQSKAWNVTWIKITMWPQAMSHIQAGFSLCLKLYSIVPSGHHFSAGPRTPWENTFPIPGPVISAGLRPGALLHGSVMKWWVWRMVHTGMMTGFPFLLLARGLFYVLEWKLVINIIWLLGSQVLVNQGLITTLAIRTYVSHVMHNLLDSRKWACPKTMLTQRTHYNIILMKNPQWSNNVCLSTKLRWHIAEWHRNVEMMPRYLSNDQAMFLQDLCDGCVSFYLKLASMAIESGELLFPVRPKIHVTQQDMFDDV